MKLRSLALAGFVLFLLETPAKADLVVFTTASPGVDFAVSDGGFYVSGSGITMTDASAIISGSSFALSATGDASFYSDAGIVLFFNGELPLWQLGSVTVATDNPGAITVNLWLDSGGDGQFFAFSGDLLQGLNGDSYGSFGNTTSVGGTSAYEYFAGPDTGATLAALQAKYPTTAAALWIGITDPGGKNSSTATADISSVTVDVTPEPASWPLAGAALLVLAAVIAGRLPRPVRPL
ncbi:MAG TPA: hypothetical protein VKF41_00100 [Bryobacteraceae bacterium]|nr:hypothetical protein [Bryobacteraceae bacterium]